jgi:hypothetical protein
MTHTRTPARLTALVAALASACACAGPANAASPVSDQYLSAPVPLVQAKATGKPGASATSKADAPSAAPQATVAGPTPAAGAGSATTQQAVKPLTVTRTADAGATVADEPLAAPSSDLPLLPLAALGLLAIGCALAAAGRARARTAAP